MLCILCLMHYTMYTYMYIYIYKYILYAMHFILYITTFYILHIMHYRLRVLYDILDHTKCLLYVPYTISMYALQNQRYLLHSVEPVLYDLALTLLCGYNVLRIYIYCTVLHYLVFYGIIPYYTIFHFIIFSYLLLHFTIQYCVSLILLHIVYAL